MGGWGEPPLVRGRAVDLAGNQRVRAACREPAEPAYSGCCSVGLWEDTCRTGASESDHEGSPFLPSAQCCRLRQGRSIRGLQTQTPSSPRVPPVPSAGRAEHLAYWQGRQAPGSQAGQGRMDLALKGCR